MTTKISKKYKRPAVQEAIFEVKFAHDSFDVALPGQIYEKVKKDYPKKQEIKHITIVLGSTTDASQQPPPPQAPVMQARKTDDSELIQIGPGIAVANRLKYSTWKEFLPAIELVLDSYIASATPQYATRIGTRYINRFVIPQENINFFDYFNLGAQIPPTINKLQGFDLTFIHKPEILISGDNLDFEVRTKFITDSLRPTETGNSFILDIDCYVTAKLPAKKDEIVSLASQAHDIVENVFESIITQKVRELMEIE